MWQRLWLRLALLGLILVYARVSALRHELVSLNLRVYHNRRMPYGEETNVIMTMTKFPSHPTCLRLRTSHYLLAYTLVGIGAPNVPPKFKRTKRLSKILQNHNIDPTEAVAYQSGFYAVVKATFWDSDDDTMWLFGSLPSKPLIPATELTTKFNIDTPSACVPELKMLNCADPQVPLKVVVLRSTTLRTYFQRSCGVTNVSLTYTFYSLDEGELLSTITHQRRLFVIQRRSMRYSTKYELWRNLFVIRAEGIHEDIKYSARCYIETVKGSVEAIIAGGEQRYTQIYKEIIMDGSFSRDYSLFQRDRQFNKFNWTCQSHEDYRNPTCRKVYLRKAQKFRIRGNAFKLDCEYEFTLRLASIDNPKIKSEMVQVLRTVNYGVLHVTISCIANCANNQYNPVNKVLLLAKGFDYSAKDVEYAWYVGGQLTLNTKSLTMHIRTPGTISKIVLYVRSKDGRSGRVVKSLMKRVPPVGGSCAVSPTEGIEATTEFYVCCTGYQTNHLPIEYFYYAGRVLLTRCYDCNCKAFLPSNLNSINVLVCDNLLTCSKTAVDVSVKPLENIPMESKEEFWKYLTEGPYSAMELANRGHSTHFVQLVSSLASRISEVQYAELLMDTFLNVQPQSFEALGNMANLTKTLGIQLNPIDMEEHNLLTLSLVTLNDVFHALQERNMDRELIEQPFINVTVACVTVYEMMRRLNSQMKRPPQTIYDQYHEALDQNELTQLVIDKLTQQISNFDDNDAKERSWAWLNAMWQNERLFRYLGETRKHGLQADQTDIITQGVSLEIQCFEIERHRDYQIETSDGMHIVYFSADLLQELKAPDTNHICLKVISIKRELHWWYPEEKQPSSILLSVRIYVQEDKFSVERLLDHSKIRYRTIVGRYKPAMERPNVSVESRIADMPVMVNLQPKNPGKRSISRNIERDLEDDLIFAKDDEERFLGGEEDDNTVSDEGRYINCLETGTLEFMQWIRLYRINVEGHAMITVRFKETTHDLQVLLYIGPAAKSWKDLVNRANCFVPAHSFNRTMVIRNNCLSQKRFYMAVQVKGASKYADNKDTPVPYGPATFSFVFQERSCDYWTYSLPKESQHWSHDHCTPVLEYQKKGTLHCTCGVLGTYTSYVYNIPANRIPLELGHLRVNMVLIWIYAVVLTVIFFWLLVLVMFYDNRPSKTVVCDMSGLETDSSHEPHDILVFLKTGGRINAQTTATVRLIFQTTKRAELQFTLMQDPEKPQLSRNSTYVLLLRTRDIRIPTRVAVAHNNGGRYPSWYLRRIEIVDVQKQLTQVFIVNRWVRQKFLILSSSMVIRTGDYRVVENWRKRFFSEFERLWINWGLWHPLTGKWRDSKNYDGYSRPQRCCVFISKLMVTYCIVACCIGPSTRHSAYEDRKLALSLGELAHMFFFCALATNLIHFIFLTFLLERM